MNSSVIYFLLGTCFGFLFYIQIVSRYFSLYFIFVFDHINAIIDICFHFHLTSTVSLFYHYWINPSNGEGGDSIPSMIHPELIPVCCTGTLCQFTLSQISFDQITFSQITLRHISSSLISDLVALCKTIMKGVQSRAYIWHGRRWRVHTNIQRSLNCPRQ